MKKMSIFEFEKAIGSLKGYEKVLFSRLLNFHEICNRLYAENIKNIDDGFKIKLKKD